MNYIDWNKLIDFKYWFEGVSGGSASTPPVEVYSFYFWFLTTLPVTLFLVGIILKVSKSFLNIDNPLVEKFDQWGSQAIWIASLFSVWFLLRQMNIGFLGARFWTLILAVWFLTSLFFIYKYFSFLFQVEYLYFKENKKFQASK
jgi:hypothetical protein